MRTSTKCLIKKGLALTLAVTITAAAFTNTESYKKNEPKAAAAQDSSGDSKDTDSKISSAEKSLEELEKKQAELDKKIKETAGSIDTEKDNQAAISEQIDTVEKTITALADSIGELETQIADAESAIAEKEQVVEQKKQEITDGISDLKKRLRVMYIAGSDSYTDILVGASDFYDMLMKIELVKRVANYDNDMIDGLVALKEQYETEEQELNDEKSKLEESLKELEARRKKQQSQMQKLEELYSQSSATIADMEADRKLYENNLSEIEKQHEEFEADLQKLFEEREAQKKAEEEKKKKEEEERKKKEEEERKKREEEEKKQQQQDSSSSDSSDDNNNNNNNGGNSSNDNSSSSDNSSSNDNNGSNNNNNNNNNSSNPNSNYGYQDKSRFTWPVPGFYHISYGVGWRWGAYHKGIDIYSENIRGANIIAADAGEVILVSNTCPHDYGKNYSCGCGGGYGNYCIIDHGDGYWTLYGHSERITVSQGQHGEKGDVLGTVGSTGHSTGPHLHFEVRINNVAQNPQDYV